MLRLHTLLPAARVVAPIVALTTLAVPASADVVLSSNDGHTVMNAQKVMVAPANVTPDTISVIDVSQYPPKIKATFPAPGSVVGPPGAIWISADESWGIVTAATKADPKAGGGGISLDNRVSVFDLTANPPAVVQSLVAGLGATQVRVSPNGALALIANRNDGTVSVFSVKDKRLTAVGKVDTGNAGSQPNAVVFVDDRTALLTRGGDNMVSVLHIAGTNVTIDPRPITTGLAPYSMDINAAHSLAAVSNMGRGEGDADSVSLIDLTSTPFHTVTSIATPSGPEPLKFSPDGKFLAIGAENGSTKPATHPFHADHAVLAVFAVENKTLHKITETNVGGWAEGLAFARDGRTILVQDMGDRQIQVFRWDGETLAPGPSLSTGDAGGSCFATAWP